MQYCAANPWSCSRSSPRFFSGLSARVTSRALPDCVRQYALYMKVDEKVKAEARPLADSTELFVNHAAAPADGATHARLPPSVPSEVLALFQVHTAGVVGHRRGPVGEDAKDADPSGQHIQRDQDVAIVVQSIQ